MLEKTPEQFRELMYSKAASAVTGSVPPDGEGYRLAVKVLRSKRIVAGGTAIELRVDAAYDESGPLVKGRGFIWANRLPVPDILTDNLEVGDTRPVFDTPGQLADLALEYFGISLDGITHFEHLMDPATSLSDASDSLGAQDISRGYFAEKLLRGDNGHATLSVAGFERVCEGEHEFIGVKSEVPSLALTRQVGEGAGNMVKQIVRVARIGFQHDFSDDNLACKLLEGQQRWQPRVPLDAREISMPTWSRLIEEPLRPEDMFGGYRSGD